MMAMNSCVIFWIICGCLIFSLCQSLWRSFFAIRKRETYNDVIDSWCNVIDAVIVYSTFIALYATGYLGNIYNRIHEFFIWEFDWFHFVLSEGSFLLVFILIWIAASLPASILRVITNSGRTKEVVKEECSSLYRLALAPMGIGYMFLINEGTVWALIPFFIGLIVVILTTIAANEFRHLITWRVMLWTSIQVIVVLGIGIISKELMSSIQLSDAMGAYDPSYAVNLISIVIIGNVVVEFLFAADECLKPKLYLPMSPSDIEEWIKEHPEELLDSVDAENDETDSENG